MKTPPITNIEKDTIKRSDISSSNNNPFKDDADNGIEEARSS